MFWEQKTKGVGRLGENKLKTVLLIKASLNLTYAGQEQSVKKFCYQARYVAYML